MNLSVIVPVGLLLAIVLALGRLYHDSEMAALQACGFGPSRLLAPLFCFAVVIALGLGWLSFVQVPRADQQAQLLRQSAVKEAQFGQLDAGRFRSFMSGGAMRCSMPSGSTREGVLHNVFVRRESAGRIEVALADTATYSKAASERHAFRHPVQRPPLRRRCRGNGDFRVIEFREHGIPIATPETRSATDPGSRHEAHRAKSGLERARPTSRSCNFGPRVRIMALVLTLLAVPLSRLRPRQGRYARVGFAIVVYFVYSNLLSAAKVWVEKGQLPPAIGVWWVHLLAVWTRPVSCIYREGRGT